MKKIIAFLLGCVCLLTAQSVKAQNIVANVNAASTVLGVPCFGIDWVLNDNFTYRTNIMFGKTFYIDKTSVKGVQAEMRYWFAHQPYQSLFLGGIVSGIHYKNDTHVGLAFPVGLNLGYSWPLTNKLSIEACYGAGLLTYSEKRRGKERTTVDFNVANFGVSLTYTLK